MSYTVYISDHCIDCEKVLEYVNGSDIKCEVHNIDCSKEKLPMNIFIVPALMKGDSLLAYGEKDIIRVLESHRARA